MNDPRRQLLDVFGCALAAVHGRERVRRHLAASPLVGSVALVAVGKAACAMAQGAHAALGERIAAAFVVTKHGHAEPLPWPVREAGHPLPDDASLAAGAELTEFISDIPGEHEVLMLLSGGASSLVERLPPGIALADLQAANRWLMASGPGPAVRLLAHGPSLRRSNSGRMGINRALLKSGPSPTPMFEIPPGIA